MASEEDLNKLLSFVEFTHLAHKVERVARINGMDRYANTVEHSYQLALIAWYIIEKEKLQLDTNLVLRYALVHDLVEVYAGDTYFYDLEAAKTKEKREEDARQTLQETIPDFTELHTIIEEYEKKETPESHFVYAVDKIIDPLNIYLEDGKLWKEKKVTLSMLLKNKTEKVKSDPTATKYFDTLVLELKKREAELFYSK